MADLEKMTLTNIGGGLAVAKFDRELLKVLENIEDVNKKEGLRKITLTVTIKPGEKAMHKAIVGCTSTLQPDIDGESIIVIEPIGVGKFGAFELNPPKQELLPGLDENVVDLSERTGESG